MVLVVGVVLAADDPLRPTRDSELREVFYGLLVLAALALLLVAVVLSAIVLVQWQRWRPSSPGSARARHVVRTTSGGFLALVLAAVVVPAACASDRTPSELRAEAARLRAGAPPQGFTVDGIALTPSPQSEADIFFPGCRQYRGDDYDYVWCPEGHARPSFGGTADRTASLGGGWYVLY